MEDAIVVRFLIDPTMYENLDMHLMNVVPTYLYESLDSDIYIKFSQRFKIPATYKSNF